MVFESDHSGDPINDMVLLRAQSDSLQSDPASFTFLGETHSKGIGALVFSLVFSLFVSFPSFHHLLQYAVVDWSPRAVHVAHTVVTHREPLHRSESPSVNGAHYVVHRTPPNLSVRAPDCAPGLLE